ncbi:hypothetical protein AG1IA_04786 [Rhizoctonia solani AG-1 IA]|uniref:Uncharacterized protein n=1 Tax=Thanatephorus cucumeris (strain AG1-IA) TaxID=983506 RepID=L8WT84_THACA|nr:hypothetical protein AG1IA_04786 [Rhizoctonia solani AG-1 IA]
MHHSQLINAKLGNSNIRWHPFLGDLTYTLSGEEKILIQVILHMCLCSTRSWQMFLPSLFMDHAMPS